MVRIGPERRLYVRIPLDGVPATMKVISVGGRPITTDPRPCSIQNASGGGLWVKCDEDLQIRRGVIATFAFTLENKQFQFDGKLIRKVDSLTAVDYAVTFTEVDEQQRKELIAALGNIRIPTGITKP